ncbi:PLD nuclease N-terminal domain-containing protein [Lysinibacillus sp. CD3-6]|uniref:PLD nuclease N-terminal domain-containing protein n=1 Tax=Lysinibacillus sp. CD3-6 TaxID=2892541 RepID=UPI00116BD34D|nr:PLD nuclease N-terminal domain-containing protein [Lysinibacillus sp. CD3-6]UED81864.1 PLD nuclease N-terminal domain-containing protein [Lysinibacillus sp. CD3-6]
MKLHYGLNELGDVDWLAVLQIALPFMVVGLILILIALFDLYRHRKERANVLLWTIVIIFFNTIGPILYFTIVRKGAKLNEVRN